MTGETKTLFITGATGYIGGTVLAAVIPALKKQGIDLNVRVLVRNAEKAEKVNAWAKKIRADGFLKTVIGGLTDSVVTDEAATADYVIDAADSDNLNGAKTIVAGLERAIAAGKHRPVVLHTSGTNILTDGSDGFKSTDQIVDDKIPKDIDDIPESQPHRDVDIYWRNFHNKNSDKFDLGIVIPPTIWGFGRGPDNPVSVQVPHMIYVALKEGQAYNVGTGSNVWTQINVVDLAEFYTQLLLKSIAEPGKHTGFYFCENGEFEWHEVGDAIQKGLRQAGYHTTQDKAKNTSKDDGSIKKVFEKVKFPFTDVNGGNARVRSTRARKEIGWSPAISSKKEFLDDIAFLVYYLNQTTNTATN